MPEFTGKELLEKKAAIHLVIKSRSFNIYVAHRLRKFAEAASREIQELEDTRIKLIKQYGLYTEGVLRVKPENEEVFESEWKEAASDTVVLPNVKLTLKEIESAKPSAEDLACLDFMLKDEPVREAAEEVSEAKPAP